MLTVLDLIAVAVHNAVPGTVLQLLYLPFTDLFLNWSKNACMVCYDYNIIFEVFMCTFL